MKVVVAEDEPKVCRFIRQALTEAGMVVDAVDSVSDLLSLLDTQSYDVLVLDRLLKGKDSLAFLPGIRRASPHSRILILSALSEVEDKVAGLGEGAHDYLAKPFHVSELIARIRALGRRDGEAAAAKASNLLEYQDLKVDLEKQQAFRQGRRIELTGKEFRALVLLLKNPGKIYSKTQLLDMIWDMNHFPESNVVEVTIANLRSKLDRGAEPLLHSRRGVGYWLGEA